MTIIEAVSAGVKDMADGSLRITFEFEPRHAADAFALFGVRGRAVAVAALKDGSGAVPAITSEKPSEVKGGALAKLAGMWCNDPEFQAWLTEKGDFNAPLGPDGAADVVRSWCLVDSRAEIDSNEDAAERFQRYFRGPYMKHQLARGVTT